jgi:hypothetical protein
MTDESDREPSAKTNEVVEICDMEADIHLSSTLTRVLHSLGTGLEHAADGAAAATIIEFHSSAV